MLEIQILNVLVGEMTARQIVKAIEKQYGTCNGSVYVPLRKLEVQGLIKRRIEEPNEHQKKENEVNRGGARRFLYSKTHKGGTWLREQELKEIYKGNPGFA